MIGFACRIGGMARAFFSLTGGLALFYGGILSRAALPHRLNLRLLGKISINQVYFTGLQALPLVGGIATLIGGVAIIQSFSLLTGLADSLIGTLLVSIVVRELGPLITGVILVGRSATAMATELGSMRLRGEVEILEAHRIDPFAFIVLPRVLAAVLSTFLLIIVFDLMGILGGFAITLLLADISFSLLQSRVLAALTNADLVASGVKAVLFGQAVAVPACFYGLRVSRSSTELPQAVTKSVVFSLAALFLLDICVAAAFYL
jgi:phospholipid/cholesterol/gamma-HCH transport system permease protein